MLVLNFSNMILTILIKLKDSLFLESLKCSEIRYKYSVVTIWDLTWHNAVKTNVKMQVVVSFNKPFWKKKTQWIFRLLRSISSIWLYSSSKEVKHTEIMFLVGMFTNKTEIQLMHFLCLFERITFVFCNVFRILHE